MNTDEKRNEEQENEAREQGSGERPDDPSEGSYPPGNPDVDSERMDKAEEDLERTKPY